jgi:hypothetical protein
MDAHPTVGEFETLKTETSDRPTDRLTLSAAVGRDCMRFFQCFLSALRRHPALERTHLVLCGERNTGHEVHYLGEALEMFSSKSIVEQKGDRDEGWWTDHSNKQIMLDDADHALGCQQIRIAEDWVVAAGYTKDTPEKRREKVLEQFEAELKRYGEHERPTNDPSMAPKVFISGRVAEDGRFEKSARDDLAFSFCFNIWLNRKIMRRIAPGVNYRAVFGLDQRPVSGSVNGKRRGRQ